MKILVTGATGFVGCYVIDELLSRGCLVVASSTNQITAAKKKWFSKTVYVEHDIHSSVNENLFIKFHQPDIAIHLAWGELNNFKSKVHLEKILPAHIFFLESLIKSGLEDFTCTGTCLEYGMLEGELDEEMIVAPTVAYAIAKDKLRKELEGLQEKYKFSSKWVRLFYMFGIGQSSKAILPLLDDALSNNKEVFNMSLGEQLRDYLPIEAVAENIVNLALQNKVEGVINCCSGVPISIKELVLNYMKDRKKVIKLNLGYYPYPDYEPFEFWGSKEKLKSIVND